MAGSLLSHVIHSLLLLPVMTIHSLLHECLSLMPQLDCLNRLLPAAAILDDQEMEWPLFGKLESFTCLRYIAQWFSLLQYF